MPPIDPIYCPRWPLRLPHLTVGTLASCRSNLICKLICHRRFACAKASSCQTLARKMAWMRSMTSSDSSHATPQPHVSISSDSSASSYDSNTSAYHRRMIRNGRRIQERLPEAPDTPEESFDDDAENVDPDEDDEDYTGQPVYIQPPEPLQPVDLQRAEPLHPVYVQDDEVQSSHSRPDGFGAGSSLAAELQHHLNLANMRVEQLEGMVDSVALSNLRAIEEEHEHLIGQITDLTVQNVMIRCGQQTEADVVSFLWMAVVALIVVVVALLLKAAW